MSKEFFADVRRGMFASDMSSPEGRLKVIREHQAICDAVRRKDAQKAQALMYAHLSFIDEGGQARRALLSSADDSPSGQSAQRSSSKPSRKS